MVWYDKKCCTQHKYECQDVDLKTHSIEDSIATATAMDMYNMVDDASLSLRIADDASAGTVGALQLVPTHIPLGDKITAYTRMSREQRKSAIHTEQRTTV